MHSGSYLCLFLNILVRYMLTEKYQEVGEGSTPLPLEFLQAMLSLVRLKI